MAQSGALKAYSPRSLPLIEDPDALTKYLSDELARIDRSISLLIQVVKQIDARLIAHSI